MIVKLWQTSESHRGCIWKWEKIGLQSCVLSLYHAGERVEVANGILTPSLPKRKCTWRGSASAWDRGCGSSEMGVAWPPAAKSKHPGRFLTKSAVYIKEINECPYQKLLIELLSDSSGSGTAMREIISNFIILQRWTCSKWKTYFLVVVSV